MERVEEGMAESVPAGLSLERLADLAASFGVDGPVEGVLAFVRALPQVVLGPQVAWRIRARGSRKVWFTELEAEAHLFRTQGYEVMPLYLGGGTTPGVE